MKKIFSAAVALLVLVSCTGNFEEYNTNTQSPPKGDTAPVTLLEELICSSAKDLQYRSWWCHNELMQYTVDVGNSTRFHVYTFPASTYETLWKMFYRYAANAQEIVRLAEKYEQPNMKAIGMTLRAMYFAILTDMFGDIPYSEALLIDQDLLQPKMDRQKEIYEALIRSLVEANALYVLTSQLDAPSKDLLYGGDIAAWKRFTNSLNLRLCLRLTNRPESIGLETLRTIAADPATYPLFDSYLDDAKIAFTTAAPFRGPFGNLTDGSFTTSSHKCSERLVRMLHATYDPRRSKWTKFSGEEPKGVPSGYTNPDGSGCATLNAAVLKSYDAPAWFMTAAEVKFILAEAALEGYIPGGESLARIRYEEGITSSLRQWDPTLTDADIDKFIHAAGSTVAFDGTLEQIIDQKWLALFMQGFESWNDYRRTGYPRLEIGPDVGNEGIMPTRLLYCQSTVSTNRTNYQEQVAYLRRTYPVVSPGSVGGDNMKTPVWWSRRAVELENAQQ